MIYLKFVKWRGRTLERIKFMQRVIEVRRHLGDDKGRRTRLEMTVTTVYPFASYLGDNYDIYFPLGKNIRDVICPVIFLDMPRLYSPINYCEKLAIC